MDLADCQCEYTHKYILRYIYKQFLQTVTHIIYVFYVVLTFCE